MADTAITPQPERAWLWVTSILALIYSTIIIAIRLVGKRRPFGVSDIFLLIAYTLALVGHVCTYAALREGLGQLGSKDPEQIKRVATLLFSAKVILHPALGFSKASILVFAHRLHVPESKRSRLILKAAIVFVLVWSIVSSLAFVIDCYQQWTVFVPTRKTCPNSLARMSAAASVEGFTQILVIVVPILCVSQMDVKREYKTMVYVAFALQITLAPFLIMYFYTLMHSWLHADGHASFIPNLIWQEALLCWSIILATTPTLRTFTGRFQTGGLKDILALPARRKQSESGTAARAAAAIAQRSMAALKGFKAFSIFDVHKRPSVAPRHIHGAHLAPDCRHWANVFAAPADEDSPNPEAVSVGAWYNGQSWEKMRAAQLLGMGRRQSLESIDFITTVDSGASDDGMEKTRLTV